MEDFGTPPFDQLQEDTGLASLEQRRCDARVTMLYKVVHGQVAITLKDLGLDAANQVTLASNRHKFKVIG